MSQIYSGMKLNMFRTVPLSIIRSLFTVHSAVLYVIPVCRQPSSRTRMELQSHPGPAVDSCLQTGMTHSIAECTVNKLLMMDRGTVRNMLSFMPGYICEIGTSSWLYYKVIQLLYTCINTTRIYFYI